MASLRQSLIRRARRLGRPRPAGQNHKPGIAIFGSYNGGSIGDSLILLGLISSLARVLPCGARICIYHFNHESPLSTQDLEALELERELIIHFRSVSPAKWRKNLGYWLTKVLPIKQEARLTLLAWWLLRLGTIEGEHLIIGGGNLVMDLFELWPFLLQRVIETCAAQGRPYALFGVGAGPISSDHAADLFKRMLGGARSIAFRDSRSLELCGSRLHDHRGSVIPDPALALQMQQAAVRRDADPTKLGVNIAGAWGERWPYKDQWRYRKMLQAYSRLISSLCQQCAYTNIVLIISNLVDLKAAHDLAALIEIASPSLRLGYSDHGSRSPARLIEAIAECSFVVATRLHACIATGLANRNFMAFSYHPKVVDVLAVHFGAHRIWDLESFMDRPDAAIEQAIQQASQPGQSDHARIIADCATHVDLALMRALEAA